jgi:hypothetical protein
LNKFYDFTSWNNDKNIYEKTNLAYEIGPFNHGVTDLNILNQTFYQVLQNHKIYHFFIHPMDLQNEHLWGLLSQHLNFISNRKNVWYTCFGHLYLYHFFRDDKPMPVELSAFIAFKNGDNVELNWQTITESNNFGFDVERASLNQNDNEKENFSKIGFVKGNGNSNSPKDYTFIDKNPAGGYKYAYRLRQIDTDGSISFSKTEVIEFLPERFLLYANYPNPFNPSTVIKYQIPADGFVTLKIYDILGGEVKTLVNEQMTAGRYDVNFDASSAGDGLAGGVYIYRLQVNSAGGNFISSKKMILLK